MPMLNMRYVRPTPHRSQQNCGTVLYCARKRCAHRRAMTRQRDLEFSDVVRARHPLMHEQSDVGHRQTRNRAPSVGRSAISIRRLKSDRRSRARCDGDRSLGLRGNRDIAFCRFSRGFMTPAD